MSEAAEQPAYVGRGGLKLHHALETFGLAVTGLTAVDLGCNLGGFTDCLLKHGASHVHAVDTAYGILDYRLRTDDRVTVMERTNALHAEPPTTVDLAVIDMGWTPQKFCIPAALKWLHSEGRIISLIKPHYERSHGSRERTAPVLTDDEAATVMRESMNAMAALGVEVLGEVQSPIRGGKKRGKKTGNIEYLALLRRVTRDQ